MAIQIENCVLLVTGANRGIGRAIVVAALERGAQKVYAAVRELDSAASLVEEFGQRVVPLYLDLENPQSIKDAAQSAHDVEVVVNNAGVATTTSVLDENAIASLEYELGINTFGLIRVAQAFAPTLQANGGGAFVQLNSVASIKSFASFATYSASKSASYAITQALRETLANQKTAVMSVHPGPILTDMVRQIGLEDIAEPVSVVADAIFVALEEGSFHVFPDAMAKQFWAGYGSYAQAVIEAEPKPASDR